MALNLIPGVSIIFAFTTAVGAVGEYANGPPIASSESDSDVTGCAPAYVDSGEEPGGGAPPPRSIDRVGELFAPPFLLELAGMGMGMSRTSSTSTASDDEDDEELVTPNDMGLHTSVGRNGRASPPNEDTFNIPLSHSPHSHSPHSQSSGDEGMTTPKPS